MKWPSGTVAALVALLALVIVLLAIAAFAPVPREHVLVRELEVERLLLEQCVSKLSSQLQQRNL